MSQLPEQPAAGADASHALPLALPRWDIFCSIVDNFGDIGVCWRLARQLAREHGIAVRLWLDQPGVACALIPGLDAACARQTLEQVEICHWPSDSSTVDAGEWQVADVVIEAFACELPASYLREMQQRRPRWINLEYLSAESWVDGFHGGSSLHPASGLKKHFFFPGFSTSTGGLLREATLLAERNAFQQDSALQAAFWQQLGVAPALAQPSPVMKISLFCYPHAPLSSLLHTLAQQEDEALELLVPAGHMAERASAWVQQHGVAADRLRLNVIPFLTHPMYDRLLWACDLNFVRGEDSWIRALWAGRPMIWQPYFQQEDTHLEKLQAFLARYCADCPPSLGKQIVAAHQAWNQDEVSQQAWQALRDGLPQWQTHAQAYADALAGQEDLAAKLVIYCKNLF